MSKKIELTGISICLISILVLIVTSLLLGSVIALINNITISSPKSDLSANEKVSALQADQEVKFNGTAIEYFSSTSTCSWKVRVDTIVSGPSELQGHTVTVALWSGGSGEFPSGHMDPEIELGDKVGVFRLYVGDDYVTLSGSEGYYITKTSTSNQPSVTVRYPNGGESISIGTQVQVSAHATDDNVITGVTFYYSRDGGSHWTLIGEGVKVSGTDKDGTWNRAWNTDGLSADMNHMIKAVASDGASTSEDPSDGTFSLTPSKVIRVPDDYPTIQGAVDAARAGNTIIVGDGIYTENLKINKSLTIKSTSGNPADTIVLAADPDADVFSVTADYVTISGLTVGGAVEHTDAGIYLDNASYSYISDNTISNNSFGIYLRDSSNNSIVSNTVSSNNYDGICLYYHNNDNNIRNNSVLNNSDGISLYGSDSNNILDNNVPNCRICLAHFSNNNKLINNNVHGIALASSNNNSIIRNKVSSNVGFGIYLINSSKNYIVENIVSMCKMHGIYLSLSSNNNTIISNSVLFNKIGIYLDSSNNKIICLNNFIKNGNNVHSYNSTNIWNSPSKITYVYNGNSYTRYLGNYRDDYTGSDADGDGIGDTPYGINTDNDFYPLLMPVENYIMQPTITISFRYNHRDIHRNRCFR